MIARRSPNVVWVPVDLGWKAPYQAKTFKDLVFREIGSLICSCAVLIDWLFKCNHFQKDRAAASS